MPVFAWDVPGYVQGHRFSQDTRYYDAVNSRFRDLAGYDHLGNDCLLADGTPSFSTHGTRSREGLLLDRSSIWKFLPAIPWMGSMLIVIKPVTATGVVTLYGWLFGTETTETSNGTLRISNSSGARLARLAGPGGTFGAPTLTTGTGNIVVGAFSMNQEDRIARSTLDGVVIDASAPAPVALHGNLLAIGSASAGTIGNVSNDYARLGDNTGDGTTTPNAVDYFYVFEQHFWKGDVLRDNPAELAAFMTSLKNHYGLT